MSKLWQKNGNIAASVEQFTIGKDPAMDMYLAAHDVMGSIAHTTMLSEVGLLTPNELKAIKKELIEIAKHYNIRLIGPNCVGLLIPPIGLNGSFAHVTPDIGDIGFVSQSGAVVTAVLDWAKSKHIGFTHVISMGDMVDFDFGEAIEYLAKDTETILD